MSDGLDPALLADPVGAVERFRTQHGAAVDPLRGHVVDALARRAAAQEGATRHVLAARVEALLADAALLRPAATTAGTCVPDAAPALLALAAQVDRLGRHRPAAASAPTATGDTPSPTPLSHTAAIQPLKAIVQFTGTWARLRVEQRLRQALDQVPAQAGPLNSSQLVRRTLLAMQGLSPAYLDAFMAHVDALQWLEHASGLGDTPHASARGAAPAEPKKRAPARAPRKR